MILAVDVGNTTISVGGFESGCLICRSHINTDPIRSEQEYTAFFAQTLSGGHCEGAVMASVVPAADVSVCAALTAILGHPPMTITAQSHTGLRFSSYDRKSVGADRIVDLVAAKEMFGAPVMVIDMGTCTTTSVLGPNREFLGGMILPGVQLSLDAMHQKAARLPKVSAHTPCTLIGNNAENCMVSGAVIGAAAIVDGFISRVESELGCPVPAVLTGGMSKLVFPWCYSRVNHEPDLLLKGLFFLYRAEAGNFTFY